MQKAISEDYRARTTKPKQISAVLHFRYTAPVLTHEGFLSNKRG